MYLYKNYHQRYEVTYLTSKMQSSPRVAFANRIQVTGVFTQPIVTITNLTIDDTGVYWCQYLRYEGPKQHPTLSKDGLTLLVVSGLEVCPTPAPTRHMMQPQDEQRSTMLVVTGITVFSLALIVFIILIIGVKHCFAIKGKYSPGPQSGGDPDYEQMSPRTTSMSQMSPRTTSMSQMRPQRDTSTSQVRPQRDTSMSQMSPRTTSMSQMRAQRDTSTSQSSGLVLINPDYAAYPNSTYVVCQ
ncbi:uncharacterized protein LOC134445342 [Engraulis encrasicolus]|uniref:uncharacterized protein LOC134445342 n=1 Tax=Engraulis encrasicolus TaxID=184585 RepID=UPI002FD13E80